MPGTERLRRRRFLEVAASSAAVTAACGGPKNRWRFLTDAEAKTLGAICDQVVPPDHDAGAVQAGVIEYIDRQLTGHYRKLATVYRDGLHAMDGLARTLFGKPFDECVSAHQLELLRAIEAKTTGDAKTRAFFDLVIAHTMQGFYGSPRHGGNRDWVSWRMLGVPSAPVRGRLHYDLTRS